MKKYLEGLFDGYTCQNKDPGFNFRHNYTLSYETFQAVVVVRRPLQGGRCSAGPVTW